MLKCRNLDVKKMFIAFASGTETRRDGRTLQFEFTSVFTDMHV